MRWTEKQMEQWLEPEQRTLLDQGDKIELEQSRLFWQYYDHLVGNQFFTEQQIVDFGHDTVKAFKLPFSMAIQDAVMHLYGSWHDG